MILLMVIFVAKY